MRNTHSEIEIKRFREEKSYKKEQDEPKINLGWMDDG
jgi:hypothetical protein